MRTYNFGAGPAMLPLEVLEQVKDELLDWHDGMSVMEVSHRSPEYKKLANNCKELIRELLNVPDNFEILFTHGGARSQFAMIPLNLLPEGAAADYVVTGVWSQLAFEDAAKFIKPNLAATTQDSGYSILPKKKDYKISDNSYYLHFTDNETINGVEFFTPPDVQVPLAADFTSSILAKPIDFKKYGLVYASAQKNLGIAGVTLVIVDKKLLKSCRQDTPWLYDYGIYEKSDSMFNTPATFSWYVMQLMLRWIKSEGGVEALHKRNIEKSNKLYSYIDKSKFYSNVVDKSCRSRINIPFRLPNETMNAEFIKQAREYNLVQLDGHRSVGGMRASLYNSMPMAGVDKLIEFMEFYKNSII